MNVQTILFDIGGVLTPDVYETVLLHANEGIARHLGLTEDELVGLVRPVWDKYAVLPNASEAEFWREMSAALKLQTSPPDILAVKRKVITVNPQAPEVFELLQKHGIRIGLISNNTSFFYKFQAEQLSLDNYADPQLVFLSHAKRLTKDNGLFELAARATMPAETLVLDDRASNVQRARQAGFYAERYAMQEASLLELVRRSLRIS